MTPRLSQSFPAPSMIVMQSTNRPMTRVLASVHAVSGLGRTAGLPGNAWARECGRKRRDAAGTTTATASATASRCAVTGTPTATMDVPGHVPATTAEAEQGQPCRHQRNAVTVANRDGGQSGSRDERHGDHRARFPEPGNDQPGQRYGDCRADRRAEQDQSQHARGQPQLATDLRDARGPAGEGEAGAGEDDVDGVPGPADLPGLSHRSCLPIAAAGYGCPITGLPRPAPSPTYTCLIVP